MEIRGMPQTHSVGDYANLLQQYSLQTDWNDVTLMRMVK
jgi:hypothetical protein